MRSSTIAAVLLSAAGCGRDTPVAPQSPEPVAKKAPITAKKSKLRTWADTQFPAGNEQTLKFLAWAKEKYELYCGVELDKNGDCVELNIHPCWPTSDEELKVIAELSHLKSLSLSAESITDDGLRYLEAMPALKKLWMVEASQITDDGINRLKRAKPDLEIELPYRKTK
jgi:hypothetical protein